MLYKKLKIKIFFMVVFLYNEH